MISTLQRHPRFAIACGLGLLCLLLLQASSSSAPAGRLSRLYRNKDTNGALVDITWRMRKSEEVYQSMLRDRTKLIKKFGPTKNDIYPWPRNREFYTLWDFFTPAFNCPHETERIGILGDGGKWMCGMSRLEAKKGCTIYSFGINDESSFEAALLERTQHCEVWGYDFSVKDFGPEIRNVPYLASRGHFKPWGLAGSDNPNGNPPMYTLQTLMKMNGHSFIDILKIDIEGYEFPALRSLVEHYKKIGQPLPFGQLQLEIHADRMPEMANEKDERKVFRAFLEWWESLEEAGLRPFWTEPNLIFVNINLGIRPALAEYSFINVKADHDILN